MAERQDPLGRAAFWSRELQINPADAEAGVKLSAALRAMGRNEEAVAVTQQVLLANPRNVEALLEDARAKIAGGAPFYAIASLNDAKAAAPKDWRPLSLLGVALEQTERPDEAREAFIAALTLSPENPAVLTNYALFHAARGDKAQAETLLRRAVAGPGAGVRERQNLALVLGLQGKLTEAERLMRQDLPPEQAAANLAYLRTQPAPTAERNWDQLGAK
jgi:Flp pilus assembly protein TadD